MKTSRHYIVSSLLRRGEIINPKSTPLDFTFDDQNVFEKKDIIKLEGRTRWRMLGR